jgi:UDP-N-acetylmuramoylalanine--D-glutamate ligase
MSWDENRVVVIGAARQGLALARYLAEQGASVVLTDARSEEEMGEARKSLGDLPVKWVLGGHPLSLLEGTDLVCPSGGVPLTIPLVQEAIWRGIRLSNDSQIFMDTAPCTVVGITGSAGKTTTTTLMGRIAEAAAKAGLYRKAFVGGNIGNPMIARVGEITAEDIAVVEFSSFQLELMTTSPQVAAVLNIAPNHLDRHGTMEAYIAAKRNIYAHQDSEDSLVLGYENELAWAMGLDAVSSVLAFGFQIPDGQLGSFVHEDQIWVRTAEREQAVTLVEEVSLRGRHNLLNVLAACALSAVLGLPPEIMRQGVKGFGGVEHRLEFVRELDGVQWYNDSKATSPDMSVTAMQAFDEPLVVLVGGRDKHLPWEGFVQQAARQASHVIAFGEVAEIVSTAFEIAGVADPRPVVRHGLESAVETAARLAVRGEVVLLAPGGTSFDEFNDYEARGRFFKELVHSLPGKEKQQ